jgi:hypothetical protein
MENKKSKPLTITTTPELDLKLEETLKLINEKRIIGELSKSKIIRIAVSEWIDRQERALQILNETGVQNGITA